MDVQRASRFLAIAVAALAVTRCEKPATVNEPITGNPGSSSGTAELSIADSVVASGSSTTLLLRMRNANPPATGLSVRFVTETGGSTGTFGEVRDNGDGTYSGSFVGVTAGDATRIHAQSSGTDLGVTKDVRVTPGPPAASKSIIQASATEIDVGQSATFTVRARDAQNNALTTGGLTVQFVSTGSATGAFDAPVDNKDGSYSAHFVPTAAGDLTVKATMAGGEVPGVAVPVRDRRDVASITVTPSGRTSAGEVAEFQTVARDKDGNVIPGVPVTWSILNPAVADMQGNSGRFVPKVSFGQATIAARAGDHVAYAVLTAAAPGGAQPTTWTPENPNVVGWFRAMWGANANDVYAAINGGGREIGNGVYHRDASGWHLLTSQDPVLWLDIWGFSANDIFFVGSQGSISHFDGTTWNPMVSGTGSFVSVWGSAPTDIWAIDGAGAALRYDGESWRPAPSPGLRRLWGFSRDNVFGSGTDGAMYRFDGANWTLVTGSAGLGCRDLWGTSAQNIYCITDATSGTDSTALARYNGSTWTEITVPPYTVQITDPPATEERAWAQLIWGTSASDIILVGLYNRVLGYDGSRWYTHSAGSGPNDHIAAIWGIGSDIFSLGLYGRGFHGSR